MKHIISTTIAVAAVVACTVAPAAAQSREQRQMMATLQMLQEQAQQTSIALAALQQVLDESVKALNARIDEANTTTRRGFADQKVTIDNIAAEVNKVRERSDDTNVRIATLKDEIEAVRTTVLALPQQLAPVAAVPADPNAAPTAGAAPAAAPVLAPPPPSSIAGLSPTRLYETATADYFQGQYSVAISGFEQYLRAFPRTEMADDAQLGIGEAYYSQKKYAEAVAAYGAVIQNYPGTNAVPTAYYKLGLSQEQLGQQDAAKTSYEAVLKLSPNSSEATLAKQALDRLAARRP
jgi:tol-pal system protein YbgF